MIQKLNYALGFKEFVALILEGDVADETYTPRCIPVADSATQTDIRDVTKEIQMVYKSGEENLNSFLSFQEKKTSDCQTDVDDFVFNYML